LPFPVSPMYSDYISKTTGLMPQNATLLYWGNGSPDGFTEEIKTNKQEAKKEDKEDKTVNRKVKKITIDEIFTELLNKVG
jgi:hypothetical protein